MLSQRPPGGATAASPSASSLHFLTATLPPAATTVSAPVDGLASPAINRQQEDAASQLYQLSARKARLSSDADAARCGRGARYEAWEG